MAPGEYASVGSGRLKLKGVKDSKVGKKKKKIKKPDNEQGVVNDAEFQDKSVVLKSLEDEDRMIAKQDGANKEKQVVGGDGPGSSLEEDDNRELVKTEAERRYEEQRRKKVRSSLTPSVETLVLGSGILYCMIPILSSNR